jgi:hypothetical protein
MLKKCSPPLKEQETKSAILLSSPARIFIGNRMVACLLFKQRLIILNRCTATFEHEVQSHRVQATAEVLSQKVAMHL